LASLCGLLTLACSDALTFERRGDKVLIPESYGSCREGDPCTLTGADCSGCCGVAAVRADSEDDVYVAVQRTCQSYHGEHCNACSAMTREATCSGGRCTLLHSTMCATSPMSGSALEPGTSGIKDPFSCNECTCQEDGTLSCGTMDCGFPCSAGMAQGTTCDDCGYNTNCDRLRTGCLPRCDTAADCGGTADGVCADGVCKRVCGR
jgi:hypothetical protein